MLSTGSSVRHFTVTLCAVPFCKYGPRRTCAPGTEPQEQTTIHASNMRLIIGMRMDTSSQDRIQVELNWVASPASAWLGWCMHRTWFQVGSLLTSGVTVFVLTLCVKAAPKPVPSMQVLPLPNHEISFQRDGHELTRYYFGSQLRRPFLYPIIGPAGQSLTRLGHPHDPES